MRNLLWVGDAACDSGFARCTHKTIPGLIRAGWNVSVLGLNYRGDPHDYPYPIYPAWPGGDMFGVKRIADIAQQTKADLVVIQNDPWNIPAYVKRLDSLPARPVVVGAIAVDGLNCAGKSLNGLDRAIFWTQFAQREAQAGGMFIPSGVVPLGVDLDLYSPGPKMASREAFVPEHPVTHDGFWVINVNRNQPRKRLDLTIQYFAEWMHSFNIKDAFLYLHVCPTGDVGVDCDQLAGYYGLKGHVILEQPDAFKGDTEEHLVRSYRCSDVLISTTQGEGWGLTTMEAMACGVPCVVPAWSALGEWAAPAAQLVPCSSQTVTFGGPNVVGGVPDKDAMITSLQALYSDHDLRMQTRQRGLDLVRQPQFRWDHIADRFAEQVEMAWQADHRSQVVLNCAPGSRG